MKSEVIEDMSYRQQWRDFRIRSFLFWFVFLTWVGMFVASIYLLNLLYSGTVIAAVLVLWTAAVAITGIYKTRWKCPRCHQPFQQWRYYNPFAIATKCEHCGLPKGAEADGSTKG
jgi:hypothetical protein